MKISLPIHRATATFSLFSSLFFAGGLQAIDWVGGTGNYGNGAQWVGGVVPGAADVGNVSNGGTANILPGDTFNAAEVWAGNANQNGTILQSGGTLNVNNWLVVARDGGGGNSTGVYTLSGGTVNKTGGGNTIIGESAGNLGTLNVSAAGSYISTGGEFWIGNGGGGAGVVNQTGGTISVNNWLTVGRNGGTGSYNLSNGTIIKNGGAGSHFIVGASGNGTMVQTGGLLDVQQGGLHLGENGASGIYNFSAGTINTTALKVGWQGGSVGNVFTMSGTALLNVGNATDTQIGALGAATQGTFNMNGGTANFAGNFQIGANGIGTLNQTAGVITITGGFPAVGRFVGGVGNLNISGGSFNQNANRLLIAEQGTGTTTVSGSGILNSNTGGITIGLAAGGNGTLALQTGGQVNINGDLIVANVGGSTGAFNVSGGSFNKFGGGNTVIGNGGTATSQISGGTINLQTGEFWVGQGAGTGVVTQTAGDVTSNNWTVVGRNGGTGTYNLNGGNLTKAGANNFIIGSNGNGTLNQNGGNFNVNVGETWVGEFGGSTGTWNMANGIANLAGNTQIGRSGTGILTQTGGTINSNAGFPVLGRFVGSTGTGTISAGALNVNTNFLIVGEEGTGVLNVSGTGLVNTPNGLSIGHAGTGNGTVNLNGGTIATSRVFENAGGPATSNFAFNGGTLRATASNATFMQGLNGATVQAGGAIIDSNGFDITIAQPLLAGAGNGGLIKNGAGILTLSSINTFIGGSTVNGGTLRLTAGGPTGTVRGPVTVNSGATLDLAAVDATGYNVGEQITTLTVNGGTVNNSTGGNNAYRTNFVLTGGNMTSTGGGDYNFTGGFGITSNASNITSLVSSDIFLRDNNNMPIAVAQGTTPSGVDLSITGVVYGAGGAITKSGPGTLSLSNINTYSGGTTVNGGTLVSNSANSPATALGTGNVTVNAGATLRGNANDSFGYAAGQSPALITIAGGTVTSGTGTNGNYRVTLPNITFNGGGTLTAAAGNTGDGNGAFSIFAQGAATATVSVVNPGATTAQITAAKVGLQAATTNFNVARGTAASDLTVTSELSNFNTTAGVTKSGAGILRLTGASTYTGPTTINGGSLIVSGAGNISSSSSVTVNSSGRLGGTGRVADILLRSGGTVAPGDSPGTLFGDSLVWDGGGTMAFELSSTNPALNPALSDHLVLDNVAGGSGAFVRGAAGTYQFDFQNSTTFGTGFAPGVYNLVDFLSTTGFTASNFSFTNLNGFGNFQLTGGGGPGSLLFVAIPEPGRVALLGISSLLMLGRRRRRK